jgi:hypothetical protein
MTTGFVTLDTWPTEGPVAAKALVDRLTEQLRSSIRHAAGFSAARVLVSLDGTEVVVRSDWASEAAHREAGAEVGTTHFGGTQIAHIEGPEKAAPPGLVIVATRYVSGHEAANALGELLVRSGRWKSDFPGFISATAYASTDGKTYVNYPQWVDETAERAYLADSRIQVGQDEIARFEVAPPEFVRCGVAAYVESPRGTGGTEEK